MKSELIEKILAECDGSPKAVQNAAARLLAEETELKVGDTVASVDEDTAIGGFVGKGKVKAFSENKIWTDISTPDGSIVKVQTSLLYLCPGQ